MSILFVLIFAYLIFNFIRRLVVIPFGQGYNKRQASSPKPKREGEVSIEFDPQKNKSKTHQVGEYVDYEEVKEK